MGQKKGQKSALSIAFFLCLSKVALLLAVGSGGTLEQRFLALNNWDSFHYREIAQNGYSMSVPVERVTAPDIHEGRANFVFFGGYPILSRWVSWGLGLSIDVSLLVVAHFFSFMFWWFAVLLLRKFKVSPQKEALALFWIWIHPAAFYLGTGYTEPLFLSGMLGVWLGLESGFCQKGSKGWGSFFAAFGFAIQMGVTRIVAWALIPVSAFYVLKKGERRIVRPILVSLALTLGTGAMCVYALYRFGNFKLYFILEEVGWGNHKRWFALFDPLSYIPRFFFEHTVDSLNRAAVPLTLGWILGLGKKMWDQKKEWGPDMGWLLAAFSLFYIPLTGKAAANMDSMVRYTLPSIVVLTLLSAKGYFSLSLSSLRSKVWALLLFGIQVWFCFRFVRGKWVA